jgi:hypothetical protein
VPDPLDRFLAELCAQLDLDPAVVDRDLVLDLARAAAHGVARPAAPLTTFLVGLAAGRRGATPASIAEAAALAKRLAAGWEDGGRASS